MKNLLIGAISGNYSSKDISTWVETSAGWTDCERILLLYNLTDFDLVHYLQDNNITIFCLIHSSEKPINSPISLFDLIF